MLPYNPPPIRGHAWLRKRHALLYHYFNVASPSPLSDDSLTPEQTGARSLCGQRLNFLDVDDAQDPPHDRRCPACRLQHVELTGGNPQSPPHRGNAIRCPHCGNYVSAPCDHGRRS